MRQKRRCNNFININISIYMHVDFSIGEQEPYTHTYTHTYTYTHTHTHTHIMAVKCISFSRSPDEPEEPHERLHHWPSLFIGVQGSIKSSHSNKNQLRLCRLRKGRWLNRHRLQEKDLLDLLKTCSLLTC